MNKKLLSVVLLLLCGFTSSIFAKGDKPIETFIRQLHESNTFMPVSGIWQIDNAFDKKEMLEKVEKAQPLLIDYTAVANLIKQKNTAINLTIPGINGGSYTLELGRYDFLSNDFQVHALGANNEDRLVDYTPGLYYSGTVQGIPGSIASFSFFNNEVYGLFSIPGEGNYVLAPNVMVGKYYDYNQHYILYNDRDLKIPASLMPHCGTDGLPYMQDEEEKLAAKTTTTLSNKVYNSCKEVRVYEVGDFSLYTTKSSSTTNVTNYLTALFNNQNLLYRNEGVPIVLKYVQINTTTDNYMHITASNSELFLDTFGKVTQNNLHGCDLAILASTRLNGGYGALGGVAWVKAMCKSYQASSFFGPYAFCDMDNSGVTNFPTFSWDVEVITHEMGHVVGSPHTHACCWNPPARNTAIDGCYTLEGSCAEPVPQYPASTVGGTIMSYCHLVSGVGINLSNGFGPQPGDTIRNYIYSHAFSATCGAEFLDTVGLSHASRTLTANRECTSAAGTTYYWYDNNTADHTDDTLVLMINKNGNKIGTLDSTGFSVVTGTLANYSTNAGVSVTFPTGVTGLMNGNIAMGRYWKVTTATEPATPVEVIFPFMQADTSDVDGSVPGATPLASYYMYKVSSPVSPNPADNFPGAVAGNFSFYTYSTAASATTWSLSTVGNTRLAHMKMTALSGGGTGFYTYHSTITTGTNALNSSAADVYVYPNATHDQWFVSVAHTGSQVLTFQLYTADGRMVTSKLLDNNAVNSVDATQIPAGIYFYRVVGSSNTYTGSVLKN